MELSKESTQANLPVQVVEERQQVDGQLDPSLALTFGQDVGVHYASRIVQARAGHDWAVFVSDEIAKVEKIYFF